MKKRGDGTLNLSKVVLGSTTAADSSTSCTSLPHFTLPPSSFKVLSEYATSSAENGLPSLQVMPGRVLTVNSLKSGLYL